MAITASPASSSGRSTRSSRSSDFEAPAPLAEEARDLRRTIQIAVVTSCPAIGIFYVLTTYAGDVFFGPRRYMARIGMLPAPLARTHRQWKSPSTGVLVQLLVTLAIGLPVGIHFGPTTAFVFLATILTAVMIAIYMIFNLSCLLYYARKARSEFNWLLHGIIPVLGIAAFLPAWFTAMVIGGSVLKFVSPLEYPSSETGLAIGIRYLIGVVVLIYRYRRHPSRLPELRRVFAEEEPAAVPAAQS
jgi:amino acid transporter